MNSVCKIWGSNYPAEVERDAQMLVTLVIDSPRAGGGYQVSDDVADRISGLPDKEKALLSTWVVNQRIQRVHLPEITEAVIGDARSKDPLQAHERADRLLRLIARSSSTVGELVDLNSDLYASVAPYPTNPTFLSAMAWSESTAPEEIDYLIKYLAERAWITTSRQYPSGCFVVTVDGYSRIEEQATNVDSSQAFIAMWIEDSMNEAFASGIEPAIAHAGYKPLRIDMKPDVDKIDDEIIAEIRRSRFMVADFTQGDDGARGAVYFEAGFAHGLGIPVIYTCRSDMVDKLHFDTRQYAHIVWNNPEELRNGLQKRILARIGEGPNKT